MSESESFIEEVNEEVRRDRFYQLLRRYGWIAVVAIFAIVGGAAWNEYQKAQTRAAAEALGDAMLGALSQNESDARVAQLSAIEAGSARGDAVLQLMTAAEQEQAEDPAAAIATLDALAINGEVPAIYREVAQFKSLTLQAGITPAEDRRQAFEALAQPGNAMRLMAVEQLALIDIETGAPEAAIERYQSILTDAEITSDLQQRALQVIVALGGDPELNGLSGSDGNGDTTGGN